MKKLLCMLAVTAMLTGCGAVEAEEVNTSVEETAETVTEIQEETAESDEDEAVFMETDDFVFYETVDEFMESDFVKQVTEKGRSPYLFRYDESRYEIVKIFTIPGAYHFNFKDKETEKIVSYEINCTTYMKNIDDYLDVFGKANFERTSAKNSNGEFDILLNKVPYTEEENYGIVYFPEEGYETSIYADNSTKEEILDYFDDFELITGCGAVEAAEVNTSVEETADPVTEEIQNDAEAGIYSDIAYEVYYDNTDEFLKSEFAERISSEGTPPLLFKYDEDRYKISSISSESNFYHFRFLDTKTEKIVSYEIMCGSYIKNIDDFVKKFGGAGSESSFAENSNGRFDILLSKTPYTDEENYGLIYFPSEDYRASIYADNSTKEEILDYFDDFELIQS